MEVQHHCNEKWISVGAPVVLLATMIVSSLWYGHITQAKLAFSHWVTIVIAVELLVFIVLLRHRTFNILRAFFTSATHPLNLALFLLYDGDCGKCRRTVASLRVCDILERVTYLNLRDREAVRNLG